MKRFAVALIAAMIPMSALVFGDPPDPFHAIDDHGKSKHVLPSPDVVRNPNEATDAPRSNRYRVYSASYGWGRLRNHGGHEIPLAGFFAVYWNDSVASSAGTQGNGTLRSTVQNFVTNFSGAGVPYSKTNPSADYTIIQQYGTTDAISPTLVWAGDFVDSQPTQSSMSDASIQSYLASLFTAGTVQVNPDTIYGVCFPASMAITMGSSASCTGFCGYHGNFTYNAQDIKYAVFPYTNCAGCSLPPKNAADMLTIVTSHEIRESVTDADGTAWWDLAGYEADDKCAWHNLYQMTKGGFWVQPEYSNGTGNGTYPGSGCVVPNR